MTSSPPTTPLIKELITKLKNSRDYKHHLKLFKEFIDKKDRFPKGSIRYFLYYDLDELRFKISSELEIPHNSVVLTTGFVPPRSEKKEEKVVQDYQFGWGRAV